MAWSKLGSDTVAGGSQATTMTVDFTGNETNHLQVFCRFLGSTAGDLICEVTAGGGTNTTHKYHWANNNTASGTSGGNGSIEDLYLDTGAGNVWLFMDILNFADNVKLFRTHSTNGSTAGAGNTPQETEAIAKWEEQTAQISSITFTSNSNTFDENSEVVVLGTD